MIGALNLRTDLRVALCRRSELSATPANESMQTAAQTEIPTPRSGMRRRVTEFGRLRSLGGLSRRTLNEAHEPPIAVDHDFASHPAVLEPVVAGCHEGLCFRCRHRPCTSLAVPARPRTGLAPNVDQLWVP